MIAQAAADGARLIVLTEMFATGFSMQPDRIAEDEGGPTEQFLLEQAAAHDVCAGRVDRAARRRTARTATTRRGRARTARCTATRRSTRSATRASTSTTPPATASSPSRSTALRVTLFVCYDLRFADEFWALAHDTDCYVVPANWPAPRREHWRSLLQARAIENQAYVVGVNRVGGRNRQGAGASAATRWSSIRSADDWSRRPG